MCMSRPSLLIASTVYYTPDLGKLQLLIMCSLTFLGRGVPLKHKVSMTKLNLRASDVNRMKFNSDLGQISYAPIKQLPHLPSAGQR